MDNLKDSRDNAAKQLQSARDQAAEAFDDGLQAASRTAKQTVAYVRDNAERAMDEGQGIWEIGVAHFEHAQDQVFSKLKEGVHWAMENEGITTSAVVASAFILLPGPRRFLWRQTLGRFRSEEAMFRSAERKYGNVSQELEGHAAEGQKLAQRLAAAEEQYDTGLRKLTAAAKQLAALQRRVRSSEKSATNVVRGLRELPSREALALRSQAAAQAASAKSQRQGLEKTLWGLSKKGVY